MNEIEENFREEVMVRHTGTADEITENHTLHVFTLFYDINKHNLDKRIL